jgi:peptidoglycan hydrolase-like protein with peptidoglycan-binding domain
MPPLSADVVDSNSRDFEISDDGNDYGPIRTWPAPVLRPDDRNSNYPTGRRARTRGLPDAFDLFRHDSAIYGGRPLPDFGTRRARAANAAGFDDAGDIYSDISNYHGQTLATFKRWGVTLSPARQSELQQAFAAVQAHATDGTAWKTVQQAHETAIRLFEQEGNRKLTPSQFQELLGHFQRLSQAMPGGGGAFAAIGSGLASVGKAVGSAAVSLGKATFNVYASPVKLAADIAQGKNVLDSVKSGIKTNIESAKTVAPYAAAVVSFVPGVGSGVSGAIQAGLALANGQSITDALVAGVKGAIPGGPIAQQAFSTAYNLAKGQNISEAALSALREQLPGGDVAKTAFDTAVALAHGQNIQQAAISAGVKLAGGAASQVGGSMPSFIQELSPVATGVFSAVGPGRLPGSDAIGAVSLLPMQVKQVAQAVLNNPDLRSLPVADLARKMNVNVDDARQAVASIVQSVAKSGGASIPKLSPANELARRIPTGASVDQAMTALASRASPPVFSHNRTQKSGKRMHVHWRAAGPGRVSPLFLTAQGFADAGAFGTIQQGSSGPDVVTWQKIIGVTADGKFGPATAAATKKWQAAHGLTADGIVGPKTWAAAQPTAVASPSVAAPTPVAVTAPAIATIQQGSSGPAVVAWQKIIGVTADGQFGPQTAAATKTWQAAHGLVADGVVGPRTWAAAQGAAPPKPGTSTASTTPVGSGPLITVTSVPPGVDAAASMPVLRQGDKSQAVDAWQRILIRDAAQSGVQAGFSADGDFGPQTLAATKSWQQSHGISPDGVVGYQTWKVALASFGPSGPPMTPVQVPVAALPIPPLPGLPGTPAVFPSSPPPSSPPGGEMTLPPMVIPMPPALPPVGGTPTSYQPPSYQPPTPVMTAPPIGQPVSTAPPVGGGPSTASVFGNIDGKSMLIFGGLAAAALVLGGGGHFGGSSRGGSGRARSRRR